MAARLGDQLVADRPHRRGLRQVASAGGLQRPRVRLRRGPLDGAGRRRRGRARAGDLRVAVPAVRVAGQRGVHREDPVGAALGIRGACGEEEVSTPGSEPHPDNHVIVLFGATGDLAKRKLLPGLYHLFIAGLLPDKFAIIGSAPPDYALSDADFVAHTESAVTSFGETKPDGSNWDEFASCLSFGAASPEDPSPLVSAVDAAEKAIGGSRGADAVKRLF